MLHAQASNAWTAGLVGHPEPLTSTNTQLWHVESLEQALTSAEQLERPQLWQAELTGPGGRPPPPPPEPPLLPAHVVGPFTPSY